ncbi:HTH-type transcriptional regulator CynR [Variovorax boronicumulans]|nr:HTH-type transcriptional regulator CynR [Variovorax boronicumulans]
MDRWSQVELFVLIVEHGSLSKAAEKLGMSGPAASRHLGALEERLGARLIERTTRRQWLTEAGRAYHQRCVAMLGEMAEAEAEVTETTAKPRGLLKVTSSVSFAMLHIVPALPEFQWRYPELAVEIVTANRCTQWGSKRSSDHAQRQSGSMSAAGAAQEQSIRASHAWALP